MPAYAYTQTIDREPREKHFDQKDIDIDGLSIQEAIVHLNTLSLELPEDIIKTRIEVESGDYSSYIYLHMYRMETPAEVAERVAASERYNEAARARRQQQFFQLKAEFENETNI